MQIGDTAGGERKRVWSQLSRDNKLNNPNIFKLNVKVFYNFSLQRVKKSQCAIYQIKVSGWEKCFRNSFLPVAETLRHYWCCLNSWLCLNFTAKFGEVSLFLSLLQRFNYTNWRDSTFMQHREKVKISLVFQFHQFAYTFDCWLKVRSRHVERERETQSEPVI